MNLDFSADQEELRSSLRKLLEAHSPIARIRELHSSPTGFDDTVWRRGAAIGWTSMFVPVPLGGGSLTDQPIVDALVVAEELGRLVQPGPVLITNVVAAAIAMSGTAAQQVDLLSGIASGEQKATWALSERDGSCDPGAVRLRAERTRDGYVLTGAKRFVEDADSVDWMLVTGAGPEGTVNAVVRAGTPGMKVRTLDALDLNRRLCEVTFADVAVDDDAIVGHPDRGATLAHRLRRLATVLQCGESVGVATALLAMTVAYAQQRVQFGRPIGSFQAVKHKLADMALAVEAATSATHLAAVALSDDVDADEAVSVAKGYVGPAVAFVAGEALQIHGGIGFTWEHPLHLYLRRAKSNQMLWGEPRWHYERLVALRGL